MLTFTYYREIVKPFVINKCPRLITRLTIFSLCDNFERKLLIYLFVMNVCDPIMPRDFDPVDLKRRTKTDFDLYYNGIYPIWILEYIRKKKIQLHFAGKGK